MAHTTAESQRKATLRRRGPARSNGKLVNGKFIPPPPPEEAGDEAFVDWLNRYDPEDLERAGYVREASEKEYESMEMSGVYTFLLEDGLKIKLPKKDCERLTQVAVKTKQDVEKLAARWIKERARAEFAKLKGQTRKT